MALSGLQRRYGTRWVKKIFWLISVIKLVPFDIKTNDHIYQGNTWGGAISTGQPEPHPISIPGDPKPVKFFGYPQATPTTFDLDRPNSMDNMCRGGHVSTGSGSISLPKEWSSSIPKFLGTYYMRPLGMTRSNQILHGDHTS